MTRLVRLPEGIMPFKMDRNLLLALRGRHARANLAHTIVLLGTLGVLIAVAAWSSLGAAALLLAGLVLAGIVMLALRLPPRATMWLYGARPHEAGSFAQVDELTIELARRAQFAQTPDLYVLPSSTLSAFSAGTPDRSAIALTEGLLRRLTMREIAGVVAREISHIRQGDLFVLGVADITTRLAQALYYLGLLFAAVNLVRLLTGDDPVPWLTVGLLICAPLLLNVLQLRLGRSREFEADRGAAMLTGDPLGLASAVSRFDPSTGNWSEDLIPPVPARTVPLPSLLRFPPPAEDRIARLRALDTPPMPPLDIAEGPRISLVGVGPIQMRPRYRWPGIWF
jgi:heat shock protein HtpX